MTEGAINKVLYNVDQRADTTDAEKKTARDNIGALSADDIPGITDNRYKLLQYPTDQTYASYAVIDRFTQDRQGVATVHCSYLTVATQDSNGLMSVSDKVKLDTVGYNAEQNVQVDWLCDDPTSDQYILHRPSITLQEQADWTEANDSLPSYIKHKPTIPSGDQLVPPATSADDGKILVVDSDGHPEWQDAGAGLLTVAHDGTLSGDGTTSAPLGVNLNDVQGKLTAGNGIQITNDVISAKTDGTSIGFDQQGNLSLVAPIVLNSGNTTTVVNGGGTSVTNNTTHASTTIDSSGVTLSNGTNSDTFDLADLQKLNGIEAGAEVNVNADWTATEGDAVILHKPDLSIYATQTELNGKQDTLTAGDNITITNNVISATAAPQLNADWTATEGVQEILHKPDLSIYATQSDLADKQDTLTAGDNITITNNVISAASQVNADWNATEGVSAIINKPQNLVQDANYVHTDNNFTTSEKTKLAGIEAGAEQNVQVDWLCEDTASDQYILHRPNIPVVPPMKELVAGSGITLTEGTTTVTIAANQTDNNFTDAYKAKLDGIEAGAQVNVHADWDAEHGDPGYIENKPVIPDIVSTTTSLPPVDTDITTLRIFTDGRVQGNNSTLGCFAPVPAQADSGKVLVAYWAGSPAIGTARWEPAPESHTFGFEDIVITTIP